MSALERGRAEEVTFLVRHYRRAHLMGASHPDAVTIARQTADFIETLAAENEQLRRTHHDNCC